MDQNKPDLVAAVAVVPPQAVIGGIHAGRGLRWLPCVAVFALTGDHPPGWVKMLGQTD